MMPDQVNRRSPRDTDGDPLVAEQMYCVSRRGQSPQFFRVFDADCELYCQPVRLTGQPIAGSRPVQIDLLDSVCEWRRV